MVRRGPSAPTAPSLRAATALPPAGMTTRPGGMVPLWASQEALQWRYATSRTLRHRKKTQPAIRPHVPDHFAVSNAAQNGRKAFIPFITAGDPDLAMTNELIAALADVGCPICEIGFPYSDPIADGPVIQASYQRALDRGLRTTDIFRSITALRTTTSAALVGMVSVAIIRRRGVESFVSDAKQAGFSGLIVPDLPCEEAVPLADACRRLQLSLIPLITPTTTDERARRVVSTASGFIYFVSVTGITGERAESRHPHWIAFSGCVGKPIYRSAWDSASARQLKSLGPSVWRTESSWVQRSCGELPKRCRVTRSSRSCVRS